MDFADVFDRAAPTYDIAGFPFFAPFGEALVEFADVGPDERVLDVGCGAGAALAPAAERAAAAIGIELSPGMAERARSAAPDAEVHVGDASALDFPDASFDVVISAFTVFFMPDPTAALQEWRRVLAPGGRIAVSTWLGPDPRWSWESEVRKPLMGEVPQETLEILKQGHAIMSRFDNAEKLADELETAGFTLDDQQPHELEFVFADEQSWWEWNWSHGSRVVLEALPESALERYREQAFDAMQTSRDGDGFPRRFKALFSLAHR